MASFPHDENLKFLIQGAHVHETGICVHDESLIYVTWMDESDEIPSDLFSEALYSFHFRSDVPSKTNDRKRSNGLARIQ